MSGDGYAFDPEAAQRVEQGLRAAIAELEEFGFVGYDAQLGRGFSDLEMSHTESGHAGLQGAFDTFTERWGWGVRGAIQEANDIAAALGLSAGLYHEQEQYVSDTLKVTVSSVVDNPAMTEEQMTERSWDETFEDTWSTYTNPEYELPSTDELGEPWDQVGQDWSTSPLSPGVGQDTDWQWDGGPAAQDAGEGDATGGRADGRR